MKDIQVIKNRIAELEDVIFYLDMVDRWTQSQKDLYDKYSKELTELKAIVIEALTTDNK